MTDLTFGSTTVTVYSTAPYVQHADVVDTGQTGDIVTSAHVEISTSIVGYNGSANVVDVEWYSATNALISTSQSPLLGWSQASPVVFEPTAPIFATRAKVRYATALFVAGGPYGSTSATAVAAGYVRTAGTATYCAYGTHRKAGVDAQIYLGEGALISFATARGAGWAVPLIQTFANLLLDVDTLCSGPPPVMPTLTRDDFMFGNPELPGPGAYAKAWTWLQAAAWHSLCECVPAPGGSPAPTPYVAPSQPTPPAGVPDQPAPLVCDASDLCSQFNQLMGAVGALTRQVQFLRGDVTLMQRQHVPFNYLRGTAHVGLSGTGEISVSDILGLSVSLSGIPDWGSADLDTPTGYYNIGELAVGNTDGWIATHRIRHNPWLVLDLDATITRVGYSFPAPIVASIQELHREP